MKKKRKNGKESTDKRGKMDFDRPN